MKKILFLTIIISVSSVLSGQEIKSSIENSYFRIDDKYFESQLLFLDSGNMILRSNDKEIYSKREPLRGRYIQQKDRIMLAPSRRDAFFEVAYRQNPEVKKGKVQLVFNLQPDDKEMYYAFQNDTLTDETTLVALEELIESRKHSSSKITIESDYYNTLILKKTDGQDQFFMTYMIPEDANELYIEYFGLYSESSMLYLLSVHQEPNSNELILRYNIKGEEEPPVIAHYIRSVSHEDFEGISFPSDKLLYGYTYLDPVDFYYLRKEYESDSNDYEEVIADIEVEKEKEKKFTDKDRWDLLHYNKTKLVPLIMGKGKQAKKAAEEYFTNIFRVIGGSYNDYSNRWYYFSNSFNNDTTDICPLQEELEDLLNIYAEIELKNQKLDTTAVKIIYRFYTELYYCNESMPADLPASVRYFMKSAGSIAEMGLKTDDSKSIWYTIETLLQCVNYSDKAETGQVYKEVMQLAPAYRDFLIMDYNSMYNRWDYNLFAAYFAAYKEWDIPQFRAHDNFLKKVEADTETSFLRNNEHPIRFCGDFAWLLNRVAADIYRDSWKEKSPYLNDAVEWAGLSVRLCMPSELPQYLDTYACLLYQTGEKEKAYQMAHIALNSLTREQQDEFIGEKIRINYELIKQNRLTSEQAWLE